MASATRERNMMHRIIRIGVGVVVVMALAHVWLPRSGDDWIPLGMVLMGVVGGVAMGSRWSIPLSPVAILAAGWLRQRIVCPDCPPGTDMTLAVQLVYTASMLGLAALGAWAGIAGPRLVSRAWPSA